MVSSFAPISVSPSMILAWVVTESHGPIERHGRLLHFRWTRRSLSHFHPYSQPPRGQALNLVVPSSRFVFVYNRYPGKYSIRDCRWPCWRLASIANTPAHPPSAQSQSSPSCNPRVGVGGMTRKLARRKAGSRTDFSRGGLT
jgi:hypothetical protein